ncbi:MAG: TIGR03619 family F420-dependent LLM class oxidoreductase [Actinomycetota bacterium]|nr:TIGR03619 family F420-dependent LLM class oxidoreductase [Actinomycetota bacterium]
MGSLTYADRLTSTYVDHVMKAKPYLSLQLRTFAPVEPDSWDPLIEQAIAADRAGIGKIVVSDHIVFGEDLDAYADPDLGGISGGKQPTGPDGSWLDPLTVLSVIAAVTTTVRLGTNILLAALRRPAALAKSVATLDVLSGGRVDLGVGVGWQKEEYEACGLDFSSRGRQLDHTLEVCQLLWADQVADYESPELSFSAIHAMPKPIQKPGVPIWVGGTVNKRSMTRLAKFGSGWIPWGPDASDIFGGIEAMRAAVASFGRDPSTIDVVGTLPVSRQGNQIDLTATMESVPKMVDAGVTDFRTYLPIPQEVDEATEYLSDVVQRFNSVL